MKLNVKEQMLHRKRFLNIAENKWQKKGIDIECWTDYEYWCNPTIQETRIFEHENSQKETIKIMPYDAHNYLQNAFNFIMEFQFETETKGYGYMYAMEFER